MLTWTITVSSLLGHHWICLPSCLAGSSALFTSMLPCHGGSLDILAIARKLLTTIPVRSCFSATYTIDLKVIFVACPPSPDTTITPINVKLPIELWLLIVHHITNPATLAVLMRVGHWFRHLAEERLYGDVTLHYDASTIRFCDALVATPYRANLVTALHLIDIGSLICDVSRSLLPVLRSLRNLEYLTLQFWCDPTTVPDERQRVVGMLAIRFPFLRGFTTNASHLSLLNFILAHPLLEDLDIGASSLRPTNVRLQTSRILPPSLHTLTCRSWFLHDRLALPATLTHLHVASLNAGELSRIAKLLGKQLVSLRVSECQRRSSFRHAESMKLDEVAKKFPRLRFLQLDMPYVFVSVRWLLVKLS